MREVVEILLMAGGLGFWLGFLSLSIFVAQGLLKAAREERNRRRP